jgi:hypothetical protein
MLTEYNELQHLNMKIGGTHFFEHMMYINSISFLTINTLALKRMADITIPSLYIVQHIQYIINICESIIMQQILNVETLE